MSVNLNCQHKLLLDCTGLNLRLRIKVYSGLKTPTTLCSDRTQKKRLVFDKKGLQA